jgi:hypothetical protein
MRKINFKPQKYFKDCKNINVLRFDFYLTDYNILIEYDGEQHFILKEFFGGESSLQQIKINDSIKQEYCYKNKIKLFRIKYSDDITFCLENIISSI